jgi:hypothetical protein
MNERKSDLIKSQSMTKEETILLREKFISEYSKKKGWNPKELSTIQMLEIATQKEYKSPGLTLS